MIKKKLLYVGIILCVSITLFGCGKQKEKASKTNSETKEEVENETIVGNPDWQETKEVETVEIDDKETKEILNNKKGEKIITPKSNKPLTVIVDLNGDGKTIQEVGELKDNSDLVFNKNGRIESYKRIDQINKK